jgi:SAM-dependent methyltransferase
MGSCVEFYNGLSRWGRQLDEANVHRVEQTVALVPPDVETVLDLGCGDGTIANPLNAAGWNVTGADISQEALQYVEGKRVLASLDQLPFPDRSFDLVVCAQVLEHLPMEVYVKALREMERLAVRLIIVTTPNKEPLSAGLVKCSSCGAVYHMDLHVRSFDREAHDTLFQAFELTKTVEIGEWRHYPALTQLFQQVLRVYRSKAGSICVQCGYKHVESPVTGWLRTCLRGAHMLGSKLTMGRKAHWIASLHRAKGLPLRAE